MFTFVENVKRDLTIIPLILANVVPLIGVLFFNWSILFVLLYYWLESVVVGFFNVLKMAMASTESVQVSGGIAKAIPIGIKLFMIPFFIVHYSGFMLGHLIFIFVLGTFFSNNVPINILDIITVFSAAISLFISHGISFLTNYVGKKEYLNTSIHQQMFAPYGRIFVMHITIVIGAFFVVFTGIPAALIVLFIALKTLVDIGAHLKEHLKYQQP
ncbi:MAG TPA: DUF6498-containing protein [archaeon]|nr:DUF6498-containing protein [archaeon]